jgi:hypothetical protein
MSELNWVSFSRRYGMSVPGDEYVRDASAYMAIAIDRRRHYKYPSTTIVVSHGP